ncbi:MAG: thioredoxin family protein [Pseudomonadota bacterium]
MLSENELMRVQNVSQSMKRPVTLNVNLTGDADFFENNLANIARQLSGVSLNRISIQEGGQSPFPGKPSLTLCVEDRSNISYMVFPEGPQLDPFLDAVSWLSEGSDPPEFSGQDGVRTLTFPRSILTFVATGCPHCPEAVRTVLRLAYENLQIKVSIIDALYFEDIASKYKVKSTPTIIIDDGLTLVGGVKTNDLVEKLLGLSNEAAMTSILKSMIDSGRAEDAAELMCDRERPDAILPIYKSNEFSRRMGALLVMEEALDRNPRILDPILNQLTELMRSDDVGLRGDTASILGKIGTKGAVSALKDAAEDPNPDVRDAVIEALENLQQS